MWSKYISGCRDKFLFPKAGVALAISPEKLNAALQHLFLRIQQRKETVFPGCSIPSRPSLSPGSTAPGLTSSSPEGECNASTIPLELNPASLRGLRFAITHTLPVICSIGTNFCRPLPISLGLPSPTSIRSQ